MRTPLTIAIIIPVFNEALNIEQNIDGIAQGIKNSLDQFTVHIVYDFDEDTTLPVIERIRGKYPFKIHLLKNTSRGVCNAIKTGLEGADAQFLLVTMADLSDDYGILPQMADAAANGFDIVCGSRYMKGGKTYGGPFIKQSLSRLAGLSLHWLTRIPTHDVTNSYKLYRKGIFKAITIESEGGFEIGMEITCKAHLLGFKITEIPSGWWDRTQGKSRFQLLKWLPKYLHWYFLLLRSKRHV